MTKPFSSRYSKADHPFGEASQNSDSITEPHMKYVQEIMLSVQDCVSYPKASKGSKVSPEKQV